MLKYDIITGCYYFLSFLQRQDKRENNSIGGALAAGESGVLCRTDKDYISICNVYDKGAPCPCGF